jgi:hypothetical protein
MQYATDCTPLLSPTNTTLCTWDEPANFLGTSTLEVSVLVPEVGVQLLRDHRHHRLQNSHSKSSTLKFQLQACRLVAPEEGVQHMT